MSYVHSAFVLVLVLVVPDFAYSGDSSVGAKTLATQSTTISAGVVRIVRSIKPEMLELGSRSDKRYCVQVVDVLDPDRACKEARCIKTFSSRRAKSLAVGDRALLASICEPTVKGDQPSLLWGSKSVLVLQSDREGPGLWSQKKRNALGSEIELETEASSGTLSRTASGFEWRENP